MSDILDKKEKNADADSDSSEILEQFERREYKDSDGKVRAVLSTEVFPNPEGTPVNERMVKKLIKCLREIQDEAINCYEESPIIYKMPYILVLIFHAAKYCLYLSGKQKQEIGTLLVKAIKPIKLYIEEAVAHYNGPHPCILQYRSALQYLIDDYAAFPAEDSTLSDKLKEANITESIKALDENISCYRGKASEEWGEWEDWEYDMFGGSSVPVTHYWWPQNYAVECVDNQDMDVCAD